MQGMRFKDGSKMVCPMQVKAGQAVGQIEAARLHIMRQPTTDMGKVHGCSVFRS